MKKTFTLFFITIATIASIYALIRYVGMQSFPFSFACWLGSDEYSISLAVHSRDGEAYDWLDAALFFKVTNVMLTEGIANLNASVTASRGVAKLNESQQRVIAGSAGIPAG